jgi:hypothetical protein
MSSYAPTQWERLADHEWSYRNEYIHVKLMAPGMLTSSKRLVAEPEITNLSSGEIVFEASSIETPDQTFIGRFAKEGESTARTLQPAERKRIPLYFTFAVPLEQALGEQFTLEIKYRSGEVEKRIVTPFRRVR